MKKTHIFLLLFLLFGSNFLRAQSAPASAVPVALGHSVVALTGPWKFHIGDNPKWADPNFDDSGWETVSLNSKKGSIDPSLGVEGYSPGWTAKGHPGYAGFAWYRIRVHITGADQPLALMGPSSFDDSYQLFTNGHRIGSFGNFDGPIPTRYYSRPLMFALPEGTIQRSPDGTMVLAFRFFMAPQTLLEPQTGGMHAPPILGLAGGVTAAYHMAWEDQFRSRSFLLAVGTLFFVFGILVLMLYVFDRTETVLQWPLAGGLLGTAVYSIMVLGGVTQAMTVPQELIVDSVIGPVFSCVWLMTWWAYFGLQHQKWIRNLIVTLLLWQIATGLILQSLFLDAHAWQSVFLANTIDDFALQAAYLAMVILIAWFGYRRPQREHGMLFLALLFYSPAPSLVLQILRIPTVWFPFGIVVRLTLVTNFVALMCFSLVLLRRFRSSQRRQQAMLQDVKQAQEVQQVLIPEELPHIPGLTIESEYRPASEVGGDFFQILPHPSDGSVLIVAGDVTGHGLQAGMMVALIVGAIRTAAQYDPDPLRVLQTLNQRLCGRGHAHATCLALRIASDGAATLANAGHLPPYLNGKELPMEGAMLLGMIESAEFSVMHFQLAPSDRLMLMSDGIAEAQDKQGHLFGFERIHDLLQRPISAAEVATAAQSFGQQDDISVLSIAREATAVPFLQPAIQPA